MSKRTEVHGVGPDELAQAVAKKLAELNKLQKVEATDKVLRRLECVTLDQVATLAGVSRSTAAKWIQKGFIKPLKTTKKERFRLAQILEFVRLRDAKRSTYD